MRVILLLIIYILSINSIIAQSTLNSNNKATINIVDYDCLIIDFFAHAAYITYQTEIKAVKMAPSEVSHSEENEFGKKIYDELFKKQSFIDSGTKKDKLQQTLDKLLRVLPNNKSTIKYSIHLINDTLINAYTSGGYIYIFEGLYNYCKNDDEIAFIIAHEIAHNELGHINLMLKRLKVAGKFGNILYAIKELTTMSFNQFNELEADCYAADLVKAAGYSPVKGAKFWKKMATDFNETDDRFRKFFMTHPYSNERYNCLKKHIQTNWNMSF